MRPRTPEEEKMEAQEISIHGHVLSSGERVQKAERLEQKRAGALLTTEPGKALLKMLEDMYYHGQLIGTTPERTYFNLGARDVIRHLHELRDLAQKEM